MDPYEAYEPPSLQVTQPVQAELVREPKPTSPQRKRRFWPILTLLALYFFFPLRSNLLILGIDRTIEETDIGRSDTIILLGMQPLTGNISMLSIPRDLWVNIPDFGESRINAAHSFGEGAGRGTGPQLAMQTVRENFDVNVGYFLRIRLTGFAQVIDALGGLPITLDQQMAGFPQGSYTLTGEQSLAFVRDRTGDDFFRMAHGQVFIVALGKHLLNPFTWLRIPGALFVLKDAVDTNIPFWLWPRYAFVFMRAIPFNSFDARTLPREAVIPWVTSGGAQVLLPNWELIRPIFNEMFGIF